MITMLLGKTMIFNFKKKIISYPWQLIQRYTRINHFTVFKLQNSTSRQKISRLPELRTVFRSNLDNTFLYPVVRSHENSDIKKNPHFKSSQETG